MTTPSPVRVRAITLSAIAALCAFSLSGCATLGSFFGGAEPVRGDDGQIIEENEAADVFSIRVGDCLNAVGGGGEFSTVPVVPCSEPHDSEAYASMQLSDGDYPGADAVQLEADAFCLDEFASFVGLDFQESVLDMTYFYPSEETWAQGDREILCVVVAPSGETITGSLAGAQR
jgi:hypothetical protein